MVNSAIYIHIYVCTTWALYHTQHNIHVHVCMHLLKWTFTVLQSEWIIAVMHVVKQIGFSKTVCDMWAHTLVHAWRCETVGSTSHTTSIVLILWPSKFCAKRFVQNFWGIHETSLALSNEPNSKLYYMYLHLGLLKIVNCILEIIQL